VSPGARFRRTALIGLSLCCAAGIACAQPGSDWVSAIVKRDLDRIEQLLPDTDDVDEPTEDGRTALMLAAGEARHELVRALVVRGASINARNVRGGSALMYAATSGDEASVALLLARGAEVNARARNGWTALTLASARGFDNIVTTLLAHGAEPNAADIYGWTPIMRAVQAGRLKVVRVLAANQRVEVNVADENGQTALHHAAAQNELEIARVLLAHGARRDSRDRAGRTPRMIAETAGHKELAVLLGRTREP
jgi:ankyrin repeat protein